MENYFFSCTLDRAGVTCFVMQNSWPWLVKTQDSSAAPEKKDRDASGHLFERDRIEGQCVSEQLYVDAVQDMMAHTWLRFVMGSRIGRTILTRYQRRSSTAELNLLVALNIVLEASSRTQENWTAR